MRFLVARMDGTPESGFAPGAIKPTTNVPLTRNFDHDKLPFGRVDIEVDGHDVYAIVRAIKFQSSLKLSNLYPAIGGRNHATDYLFGSTPVHHVFEVMEVSLCDLPNVDPKIPRVSGKFEETR